MASWRGGDPRSASVVAPHPQRDPCQSASAGSVARGQAPRNDDRLSRGERGNSPARAAPARRRASEVGLVDGLPARHQSRMPGGQRSVPVFVRRRRTGPSGSTGAQNDRAVARQLGRRAPAGCSIGKADARRQRRARRSKPARPSSSPSATAAWPRGAGQQVVLRAERDRPDLGQHGRHQRATGRLLAPGPGARSVGLEQRRGDDVEVVRGDAAVAAVVVGERVERARRRRPGSRRRGRARALGTPGVSSV